MKKYITKFRQKKPSIIPHTVRYLNRLPHGTFLTGSVAAWPAAMYSRSDCDTLGCSLGFLYICHQNSAHTKPSAPVITKDMRQPSATMSMGHVRFARIVPPREPLSKIDV